MGEGTELNGQIKKHSHSSHLGTKTDRKNSECIYQREKGVSDYQTLEDPWQDGDHFDSLPAIITLTSLIM
jgi:hypothetical protein